MSMEHGSFNLLLVGLSYIISVCGSFTALAFARESAKSPRPDRLPWVVWAAVVMGGVGIWSMHFVGMMAYHVHMPINYDIGLTALSMLLAILSTGIGFAIVGLFSRGLPVILVAGVCMGTGVAAMHYTGMAAMRMGGVAHYDMTLVWISVGIAIAASSVALWMAFYLTALWQMTVAAVVAGIAVCGMHYTGMAAVRIVEDPRRDVLLPTALSPLVVGTGLLALSLLVLAVGMALTRTVSLVPTVSAVPGTATT
jgi:NO-binding membrane sensor protein with MHYT domain